MKPLIPLVAFLAAALTGCAGQSSNLRIGNDQTYASLSDQREAIKNVLEYDSVPVGAKILGEVDAGRCHRIQGAVEPSDALVKADLKVTAYAQGADGISNITLTKEVALTRNCWHIITGKATMFSLRKP
jgi:hypothetical protein